MSYQKIKQFFIGILLVPVSLLSVAQANLVIDGAKMNVGANIFLSTNDIKVVNTNLIISGSTLKIAGAINSANVIDASNGTVEINGSLPQQIPANVFTGNIIKNLTINGDNNATIGGALTLTNVLALSNGSLDAAGYLTLRSDSNNTARVATVTSSAPVPVSGEVTVERFVTSRRAYRYLTAPVNTSGNIRANWMENVNNPNTLTNINPVPHYGTQITGVGGSSNGFDASNTNNASLFTFNTQTQTWAAAPNTFGQLHPGNPYRLFVRGDRSTNLNLNAPPSSITTIRSKGTLITGTVVMAKAGAGGTAGMPELNTTLNGYSFIGNPYASPIDWLLLNRTDIAGSIYVFDPTIDGTNGRGGYLSYNGSTGVSNTASLVDNNIQSGQAFLVQTVGPNPSITFKENYKVGVNRNAFRNSRNLPRINVQLLLPGQLNTRKAADGLAVYFSNDFDSSLQDEDSYKLSNQDENIAILRNGKSLSIEGRKPVTLNDTIPFKIWQLSSKSYTLKIDLTNFSPTVEGYLEDAFLNTSTKLNNDSATIVPFSITSNAASSATDRFRIVFETYVTLPVQLTAIKAYEKNKGVQVEWMAESESNMNNYEVEKSNTAQQFVSVGSVKANANPGASSAYNLFDENPFSGDNFYRVKSVSKSGEIKYTGVVKVQIKNVKSEVTASAGPGASNIISLYFKNVDKGDYAISVINSAGQKVYEEKMYYAGGTSTRVIKMNNILTAGIYQVQVLHSDKRQNISVLVQ